MFLFIFWRQFHNSNAQLDVLIGELRAKLDYMGVQNLHERKRIADQEASRGRLQVGLLWQRIAETYSPQ